MAKVVWESEGKNIAGEPYLRVEQNGHYYYACRGGDDSVAFVLFDRSTQEVAVISERKPPLDSRMGEPVFLKTAFGGSIDKPHSIEQIVMEECKEEAGFTVHSKDVHHLGRVMVSTQMNQFCELFIVFVDKHNEGDKEPENVMESLATTQWLSIDSVYDLEDWKSITILTKAGSKGLL